jgi:hypothetical protein
MPRSRRRIRSLLGALLSVLAASMFLALAAPPAGAVDPTILAGDWGYLPGPATGSDAASSAEYGPQIAHATTLLCLSSRVLQCRLTDGAGEGPVQLAGDVALEAAADLT